MAGWRRRVPGIPSAETGVLRRVARRTLLLRWLLAATAGGLLFAALASARDLDPERGELLPGGRSGVVVIDMSLSITNREFRGVRNVLERLVATRGSVGLVAFSDIAYELVPPRTPTSELRPMLRFYTPSRGQLPKNPWSPSFQAGTRISVALELAQKMLSRDRIARGSILLVSDLETAPQDLPDLGRTLERLRNSPIAVRVVALSPTQDGVLLFRSLLGNDAFVGPLGPSSEDDRRLDTPARGDTPLELLLLGGFVLLVLAAHERFAGRLALPYEARGKRT